MQQSMCTNGDKVVAAKSRGCSDCLFGACRKIGPRGNSKAEFVIVGEGPGTKELGAGVPFVGPGGEVLESNLPKGLEYYVTTAIACRPAKKDAKILSSAVNRCSERLFEEIKSSPRKVILALGNGALWALTGDHTLKITQERGRLFKSPLAEVGILATVHPAFLLRGGGSYKKFQADVQYAVDLALGKPVKEHIIPEVKIYRTEEEVRAFVEMAKKQPIVAGDIETTGFSGRDDEMLSIGFSWDPKTVHIVLGNEKHDITLRYWDAKKKKMLQEQLNNIDLLKINCINILLIKDFLESPATRFVWHNGKYDVGFLRAKGIKTRVDEDTMLLNYALDETRGIHGLEQVSSDLLGSPDWKGMIDQHLPRKRASYAHIPQDVLLQYQGYDISNTLQIFLILRDRCARDAATEKFYTKTLIPASELLINIEARGFLFDWEKWEENKVRLTGEVAALRQQMCDLAGYDINPASSVQMVKYLFDELRLPTKTRSTAKKIVTKLPKVPAVKVLVEFRVKQKQLSTYIIGMFRNIETDGCAHSTFLLHGTRTSRLASRNPNMQNIPRDKKMRAMFKARPGYILVSADYSQAELRTLATLSGDATMCAIFNDPKRSIHKEVAVVKYGVDYTETQYVHAKMYNFGIVYGRTCFSIAEEFNISPQEAQKEIDDWFKQFPDAHTLIKNCRAAPMKQQNLVTVFGNKCRPGLVTPENLKEVQNEFSNFPHQATASNCTVHAAIRCLPEFEPLDIHILNLVHDNIVAEVPDNEESIAKAKEIMSRNMQQVPIDWGLDKVPFLVDFKMSYSWDNAIEVDEKVIDYVDEDEEEEVEEVTD